jgi:poly-gamma-glutamate synthesis protein (capsule biosynthesis protein)
MLRVKEWLGLIAPTATAAATESATPDATPSGDRYAVIAAVGDILIHSPILTAQYDPAADTFDFNGNYKYVKALISGADLAIANFETSLGGGPSSDYSGYPTFNSPDALAVALKNAGFDMLTTANNHIFDSGEEGFLRTGAKLRELGFDVLGTRTDLSQKRYLVKTVNGIRIGFTDFTYDTGAYGDVRSLNGIPLTETVDALVNTFGYDTLDDDLARIGTVIDDMRADGAELVVVVMHWGNEYETTEDGWETGIAGRLADFGVDVVIGGHPHVLQPIKTISSDVSGKTTLVAYSTGNFISNQRAELMEIDNPTYPEDGMILFVRVRKDAATGKASVANVAFLPTWVHKFYAAGGIPAYEILPARDAIAAPADYNLGASPDGLERIRNSLRETLELMAKDPGDPERPFRILEYPEYLKEILGTN